MLVERRYNRLNALRYAFEWATGRNPLFMNYTGLGGDCTNFVSQCLLAGCCRMNYTPVFGWFYIDGDNRTASWTGVEFFYNFLVGNEGVGPYASEVEEEGVQISDIVQLQNDAGDYYHTLFVCGFSADGEILVAAHSDDSLNRPLSSYNYAAARFLHVEGVRFEVPMNETSCFENLIGGVSLLP